MPPVVTISFWARWDIQCADSHWDRRPRHSDDLLKRGPTKISAQLRCHPCWPSLRLAVHSWRCFPEAHFHQSFQLGSVAAFETQSDVDARRLPAGVVVLQRARTSVLRSTGPPSVYSTKQDGALKLMAVTAGDCPFILTLFEAQPLLIKTHLCDLPRIQARCGPTNVLWRNRTIAGS